jgi:hypothetical protein
MGEITVRAETNVLNMRVGDVQVVEDTPFMRKVVNGGRLSIVKFDCADTAASADQPAPDGPEVVPSADAPPAPTKGARREHREPDAPVITVRAPDLPPAA